MGLSVLTECLYRFIKVPGFDRPFRHQDNYGNYVDVILMNKINPGGWVAINCIPPAATLFKELLQANGCFRLSIEKPKSVISASLEALH